MTERPHPERETSPESPWREAAAYYPIVAEKLAKEPSVSMQHILGNLGAILHPDLRTLIENTNPALEQDVIKNLSFIKRYFRLLEAFPEFREKEEGGGEGYFPDLVAKNLGSRELVTAYEAALGVPTEE